MLRRHHLVSIRERCPQESLIQHLPAFASILHSIPTPEDCYTCAAVVLSSTNTQKTPHEHQTNFLHHLDKLLSLQKSTQKQKHDPAPTSIHHFHKSQQPSITQNHHPHHHSSRFDLPDFPTPDPTICSPCAGSATGHGADRTCSNADL